MTEHSGALSATIFTGPFRRRLGWLNEQRLQQRPRPVDVTVINHPKLRHDLHEWDFAHDRRHELVFEQRGDACGFENALHVTNSRQVEVFEYFLHSLYCAAPARFGQFNTLDG